MTFGYADVAACSENLYAEGTYYVKATAGNPYIASGSTIGDGMDLAWAVDKDGKPVDLSGKEIHYIRVQNVVDVPANGSFGEVSTEIGTLTKINPSSQQENVGVTAEPEILAMGESLPEAVSSLKDGAISYYEIDLEKHGFPMVSVTGAEDDVIYVNMEQYTGSAEYIGLPDENGERTVRILVQNGKCEPRIYVIHFTNANDPTTSTELASIIANDTIRLTEDTNGGYSGTVMNLNSYVAFNIRSLNPQAAIELRAGNGEYTTVTYGKNTETYPLSVGSNLFTVRVTAVDGSQKEYPMVVTRQSADSSSTESKNITVKFTFTGDTIHYVDENNLGTHTGDTWIATQSVTVPKGSTVKDVTDAMLQNAQIDFVTTNNGTYISEVQIPSGFPGAGEYLAEFSNGPNSGWMYRVNNKIADVGYAAKQLSNGDAILWFYTDDYTQIPAKDYENYDPSWGSGSSSSATATKEEITVELTPEATVNSNGEAKAEVADKEIDAAVASAKKDNADAIIIAPEVKGDADKVTVELSKDAVGSIAKETDAALAIQTEIAEITVPNSGLAELNQQSGSKVTFSAETVAGEDGKETGEVKIEIKVDSSAINQLDSGVVVSLPAANKNSGNVLAIVNSDGSQTLVKKSVVEGNNVKAIVDGSVTVKIIDNSKDFTDMAGHWAADAVDFVTSRELFNGTNEGIFSPSEQMTRAMLVTVLHRLEDEPAATATTEFSDVAADSWYAEAVAWASQQKIVNGTGDNLFSPEQSISREELATMLYRYADVLDMDMTAGENAMADFQDAGQVSDWAKEAMNWAVSNGFITGKTNATLDAGNTATRAEVAAILQRMVEWMVQ